MIDYIKGAITRLELTEAVIEAGGIGYLVNISLTTYSRLHQNAGETTLLIHEIIREDTHDLYGFSGADERAMFRLLIGVSGVGPNTARVILSSLTPDQLQAAISADDHTSLKAVKGIGLKTAQRIIVDLKDKIASALPGMTSIPADSIIAKAGNTEQQEEALAALVMLGFNKQASQKALTKIFASAPATSVEAAIKRALSML